MVSDGLCKCKKWQSYRDCKVIASSQLGDLTAIPEACPHHNGLVSEFLVVVEDLLHRLYTRILLRRKFLFMRSLVPIKDAAHKGRDEECACLRGGDGLWERKEEGEVAIDAMFRLQNLSSLDAFPSTGELDEDPGFVNADIFVELRDRQRFRY